MNKNITIETLISIDETGLPCAPTIRQLQDKDVLTIYARDKTPNKEMYIKEAGVIYYLGDPESPANQQGLNKDEALKLAIENYNLPKNYYPDKIVERLINKYYNESITEAGKLVEILREGIHLGVLSFKKINERLTAKLTSCTTDEDIVNTINLINTVNAKAKELPNSIKTLKEALENLQYEKEEQFARGKIQITSSMIAE